MTGIGENSARVEARRLALFDARRSHYRRSPGEVVNAIAPHGSVGQDAEQELFNAYIGVFDPLTEMGYYSRLQTKP